MKSFAGIVVALSLASGLAAEQEITFATLLIGTNKFDEAHIRRAGPSAVIVHHRDGMFSIAITNLPPEIRTNFPVIQTIKKQPAKAIRIETAQHDTRDEKFWAEVKAQERRAAQEDGELRAQNPNLAAAIESSISEKRLCIGMRDRNVRASVGYPLEKFERVSTSGITEVWVYSWGTVQLEDGRVASWVGRIQ